MTKPQTQFFKVQREQSTIRERLGEIRLVQDADITPALRAERTTLEQRQPTVETEFRAALDDLQTEQAKTLTVDAESRALRQLTGQASLGDIFAASVEQRQTEGPTKELQEHFGLGAHSVPLEMLREEHRAVTPAPGSTGVDEAPVVQPVFALGDAAFLNVSMPTVPSGDAIFPVLTTRPAVGGPHTDSSSVSETTGAFSAVALPPSRLQASFFYLKSDAARFRGMSESLRSALSMGLSEKLDAQVITQIVTDVSRVNRGSVSDYAHYKSLATSQVDGRFAASESDVRAVMGGPTFVHANTIYRASETSESAVDAIRRMSGGLRVSAHIAGVSGSKQDVIVRRGSRMDMVAPLWAGVDLDSSMIIDPFTKASTGEVVITAALLAAFKVIRTGAFGRLQTQHA